MSVSQQRSNPYVGPRALVEGEPIFGRSQEERRLFQLLVARRIALLHSPSGAGKTSLVQAGLVPKLRSDGFRVLPTVRLNKQPPDSGRPARQLNRYHCSLLLSLEEKPEEQFDMELSRLSLADYLSPHFGTEEEPELPVLIVDQLEELLNIDPTDIEAKESFFVQLGQALRNPRLWALFVIREDYLGALEPLARAIPTRLVNTFRLDLLDHVAASDAIRKPAESQGVTFTEAAVEALVDDLCQIQVQQADGSLELERGPYVEPVQLQVICHRLWQHLPAQKTEVGEEDLQVIGNVDESLAAYFASCVRQAAADPEIDAKERHIRQWVQNKLITRDGVRLPVLMGQETTEGLDNRIVSLLQDAHLLRADKRGGMTWYELAHDRLVSPIQNDNVAWFNMHLSLLQRQSQRWSREDRPDYLLLRGIRLEQAEEWAATHDDELTGADRTYLAACLKERDREQEMRAVRIREQNLIHQRALAEEQRKRAEEAEAASTKLRQRRNLAFVLATGSLVLAVIALFLFHQSSQNAAERVVAESAARSSEATALAALVVANSEGASQKATAQSALATNESILVQLLGTEEALATATQPPTGSVVPTSSETRGASTATPSPAVTESVAQPTLVIALQPMQFLNIQLQDIRVQQTAVAAPRALTAAKNGPIAFDSTRDGNTNIYVMNDDGSNLRQLTNSSDYQGEADISPSGQWIAFEEQRDDSFYIYTMPLEGGQPLELVRGRQPDWSPDGGAIAYESVSSPKQLWTIEVSDGRPVGEPVRLPTDSAFSARAPSWSPDGDQIVFMIEVAGYWQLAILDVGRNAYRLITEGDSNKRFPVWSPDGELIAFNTLTPSGAPDQIWVVEPSGEEMHQLTVEGSNGRPAWSPDGRFLLFNSYHDGRWLLYKIDRDGSNPTALTSEGSDQRANWGP